MTRFCVISYQELVTMSKDPTFPRRKVLDVYRHTRSIRETARMLCMSRNTVRKIVRRWMEEGEKGLHPRSRKPHQSPRKTPQEVVQKVLTWKEAMPSWGSRRIAGQLYHDEGIRIHPVTVWRILRREGMARKQRRKRKEKTLYPAVWTWETYRDHEDVIPFQVDWKHILDRKALGSRRYDHIRKRGLPRYQLTLLEARSRLRLVFYAHRLSRESSRLGMVLGVGWMRKLGLKGWMVLQTDHGEEFGGTHPERLAEINIRDMLPVGAQMVRYPMGRKQYNGRVERSHRMDDEEFYVPRILEMGDVRQFLVEAARWIWFYNMKRAHFGAGMGGKTPWERFVELYGVPEEPPSFPVVLLDDLAVMYTTQFLPAPPQTGQHVLQRYTGS